jgi:abhydrolase domain-containing protein 1/3
MEVFKSAVWQSLENIKYLYEYVSSIEIITVLRENFTIISVTLYTLWYVKAYLSRTELIAKEGSYMHRLVDKITCVHTGYRPTMWCFPAMTNTIIFALIQRIIKHHYYREVLNLSDGGHIAIDWANLGASNPVIMLVLPGLTGSSKDNYVSHMVDKAVKANCTAVVMNYRGIEIELKTPRTYCASNYDDLHSVVNHIHEKYPEKQIFAVGISLGGIKLGGYIAKQYDDCLIKHALIVSAPLNVFYSCKELEKTHYMLTFNKLLTRNLGKYFRKNQHFFEGDERYDVAAIMKVRFFRFTSFYYSTSTNFNIIQYSNRRPQFVTLILIL